VSEPLPLAAAAARLRRPAGRPRKAVAAVPTPLVPTPLVEQVRRLLDLNTAAAYLGLSPWTLRDLEARGVLPRVRVPLPNGGELRKLLFDRADLDRLIERWKDRA
jgi:hypothetical protein